MSAVYLCPLTTNLQYFTNAGLVLNGGKIATYIAGSSTPQATYTDSTGVTPNANPIILNSAGALPNVQIWQPIGVKIKVVISDSANNVLYTLDQLSGIDDPSAIQTSYWAGTDTGSPNVYILTVANAGFSSYTDGLVFYWVPGAFNSNTGAATLNINGLGNVAIVNPNGSALSSGEIIAGQPTQVVSVGGQFVLVGPAPPGSGPVTFTVTGVTGISNLTCKYIVAAGMVYLTIPAFSGAGTGTAFTMNTANLAVIAPKTQPQWAMIPSMQDNGSNLYAQTATLVTTGVSFPTGMTITFYKNGNAAGWTATGSRGMGDANSVTGAYGFTVAYPF